MITKQLLTLVSILCFCATSSLIVTEGSNAGPISEDSEACLECHESVHPGIVADWRSSRHAGSTPEEASKKSTIERRVSNPDIPETLRSVVVGCWECHGLNPDAHKDNFDHFGYQVNTIVSPKDCRTCHTDEARQYETSKKAHAFGNLQKNPVYHTLVDTVTGVRNLKDGELIHLLGSESTKANTCYACHGTKVTVQGIRTVDTDFGETHVPVLTGWPNQGVGRINPDGSMGACTACHPRHSFSIEVARKPYTCSQCHLDPDTPAWNIYRESKHGNIFQSLDKNRTWETVPWTVGKDLTAPTCATCHNSLLVDSEGEVIVKRTHDFGARLCVRLFGLIYAHPQPKSGDTSVIKNKDGLPLPTSFTGEAASEYLIDAEDQAKRKATMQKVCTACHSSGWTESHFARLEDTVQETNRMTLTSTKILLRAWEKALADQSNPFDESIEQLWMRQWLFYANSIRYAAAMGGPDYAAFKNGWWNLTETLQKMHEKVNRGK